MTTITDPKTVADKDANQANKNAAVTNETRSELIARFVSTNSAYYEHQFENIGGKKGFQLDI